MPASRTSIHVTLLRIFSITVLLLLAACQTEATPEATSPAFVVTPTLREKPHPQVPYAEVTFEAQLPEKLADGQNLFIEILDEVTGLAFNPARARMETTDQQYFGIKIPITVGSVVKYRYYTDQQPFGVEYTTGDQQVRYRLYYVDGPGVVRDIVAAWRTAPSTGTLGRIQGQVANETNNSPVVNALVTAGGAQTLTASDGSFILEGLLAGTHNLVVYSLDGAFRPFQQGATVAPDSTTPALVMLSPAKLVNVTFLVAPPEGSPKGAPVRMLGNIFALGNTFADLNGGMNTLASRAPLMQVEEDGRYKLTLRLPAGLDVRYKYSLGDGFWNAERGVNGEMQVRQLIVPEADITIEDAVASWKTAGFAPVTFTVTVPANTPITDTVSIQFNPFGWTQPIPMWPVGQNRWFYVLYNPLNLFENATYRYCRNEQCNTADASGSRGPEAPGKAFHPTDTVQNLEDVVESWAWIGTASAPVVIPGTQITAHDASFQAGVELVPQYHPSWQPYFGIAFQNIADMGANTVMLAPTWSLTHQNPPVIAPVAGEDAMWPDLTQMVQAAQQKGLGVAIHPVLRYDQDPQQWWSSATRDDGWWQTWFARYQTFILYNADLASQTGAKTLVIGDETILPALPGGTLSDGTSANPPGDAEERWTKIISAVRARFTGKLIWMLPYTGSLPSIPEFLTGVDIIYVRVTPPVLKADSTALPDLESGFTNLLDVDLLKLQEKTNHPIILGLSYPSVKGMVDGCAGEAGSCVPFTSFVQPGVEVAGVEQGLEEQALVYSAALASINQHSWITGFYASDYYPPVELKDLSTSIRGKPASDVLWYWYPRLLGKINP